MGSSYMSRSLFFLLACLFFTGLSAQTLPQATLVKDINPGPGGSSPANFIKLANGKIFFSANNNLWVTDGTGAGTALAPFSPSLAGYGYPTKPVMLNGKVYFIMATTNFVTLWSSPDGISASLIDTLASNIPSYYEARFDDFYTAQGNLYISIKINSTLSSGVEKVLYRSSGEKGSLKTIGVTNNQGYDTNMSNYDAVVLPGSAKTYIIKDVYAPTFTQASSVISLSDSAAFFMTPYLPYIDYFAKGLGVKGLGVIQDNLICVYKDTLLQFNPQGQRQVLALNCQGAQVLGQLGNEIYFQIPNTNILWKTDGSAAGTVTLTPVDKSNITFIPIVISDSLFLTASFGNNFSIWKIDNSTPAFKRIFNITAPSINLTAVNIGGRIYLTDISETKTTFFEPDLIKGKIKIIGQADNLNNNLLAFNNTLYMGAGDSPNSTALTGVELKSLSLNPSVVDYPCLTDTTPPVITNCLGNLTVSAAHPPICSAQSISLPAAYDNCSSAITVVGAKRGSIGLNPPDINNGNPYYLYCSPGVDTITYYARDLSYNVSSCSFIVTIPSADPCANDIMPPVFTNCPQNITQTLPAACTGANCGAQVTWTPPTATDNCSSVSLTGNYNPGFFPVGTTSVVYSATDAANNKSTCSFTVTVSASTGANNYCASKANMPWTEWIAGVQFADLNNPSSKEGYGDFTAQTATVQQGQTYPLNITKGFSWAGDPSNAGQSWAAWIDYNQNNVFDATELVASGNRNTSTANIVIPASAPLGKTRMRISMKTAGVPTACETFDKGEVEDYTINIIAGTGGSPCDTDKMAPVFANCPKDSTVQLVSGEQSRTINWTAPTVSDNCTAAPAISLTVNGTQQANAGAPVGSAVLSTGDNIVGYVAKDTKNNASACNFTIHVIPFSVPAHYCASKSVMPWTEWIAGVQFSNVNNPSGKEGYGDFTSQVAVVKQGQAYPLTLTKGFSWAGDPSNGTQAWAVWIDYNQNNIFEASELAASGDRNSSAANIIIPATATLGNTRMRISLKTAGAPTACEAFDKGEVEDYTVNIAGGASGQPDLTLANLNAPASATAGASLNYTVDLKNIGTAPASTGFVVGAYLSKDTILSADDLDVGVISQGVTAVGTVAGVGGSIYIPSAVGTGAYYLILKADRNNSVAESNENNNTIYAPMQITGAAAPPNCKTYTVANTNDICGVRNYAPYALFLTVNGQTVNYHADQLTFTRNGTTATLKGIFRDQNWAPVTADLTWSGGTATAPTEGAKKGFCLSASSSSADWFYYPALTGTLTIGGQTLTVTKRDSAFQIGTGANQQNTDVMGASGLIALSNGTAGGFGFKLLNETTCGAPTASAAIQPILELSARRGLDITKLYWTSNEMYKTNRFTVEKTDETGVFQTVRIREVTTGQDASVHFLSETLPETEAGVFYYRVRAIFTDGASRVSAARQIEVENTFATTISPNPAESEAFVDLTDYIGKAVTLTICDLAGKVLSVKKIGNADAEPPRLDLSALRNGIYFVSIQTPGKQPIIKKLEIIK